MDERSQFLQANAIVIQPESYWSPEPQLFSEFNGYNPDTISSRSIHHVQSTVDKVHFRNAGKEFFNNNCYTFGELDNVKCDDDIDAKWSKHGSEFKHDVKDSKVPVEIRTTTEEMSQQQGFVHEVVPQAAPTDPAALPNWTHTPVTGPAPAALPNWTHTTVTGPAPAALPNWTHTTVTGPAPAALPNWAHTTVTGPAPAPPAPATLTNTTAPTDIPTNENPTVPMAPAILAAFGALAAHMPSGAPVPPIVPTVLASLGFPVTPTAPTLPPTAPSMPVMPTAGFPLPSAWGVTNALPFSPAQRIHEAKIAPVPPIVSTVLEAMGNPISPMPNATHTNMPNSNRVPPESNNNNGQFANSTVHGLHRNLRQDPYPFNRNQLSTQSNDQPPRKKTKIIMYSEPRIVRTRPRDISTLSQGSPAPAGAAPAAAPTPPSEPAETHPSQTVPPPTVAPSATPAPPATPVSTPGACPCCDESTSTPPCPCRVQKQSIGTQYEDDPYLGRTYTKEECKTMGTEAFKDVSVSKHFIQLPPSFKATTGGL